MIRLPRWVRLSLCLRVALGAALVLVASGAVQAQDRRIAIAVPETLVETGFLRHLLPRFSLKHGVPITLVGPDEPSQGRIAAGPAGDAAPVFASEGVTYVLRATGDGAGNPNLEKLDAWLRSDPGRAAIESFAGPPRFTVPTATARVEEAVILPGDVQRGKVLSLVNCGRCHVVGPENRMDGIGNTPSFAVLRTLPDWEHRFATYYALNPHQPFSRIDGVTDPYSGGRTPTIAPVDLTLRDVEDITAFAASVAPADLGAPIKHQ